MGISVGDAVFGIVLVSILFVGITTLLIMPSGWQPGNVARPYWYRAFRLAVPGGAVLFVLAVMVALAYLAVGGWPSPGTSPTDSGHPDVADSGDTEATKSADGTSAMEMAALSRRVGQYETKLVTLIGELAEANATCKEYARQLDEYQQSINQLRAQLDQSRHFAKQRESLVGDLQVNLRQVEQQLATHQEELAQSQQKVTDLRNELAAARRSAKPTATGTLDPPAQTERQLTIVRSPPSSQEKWDDSGWRSVRPSGPSPGVSRWYAY